MAVLPSSKYNRLSEVLVNGGSDTASKSEGVVAVTDASTFPAAFTNPRTYGPAPSPPRGAPTAASGLTTPVGGELGVGETAGVAGASKQSVPRGAATVGATVELTVGAAVEPHAARPTPAMAVAMTVLRFMDAAPPLLLYRLPWAGRNGELAVRDRHRLVRAGQL